MVERIPLARRYGAVQAIGRPESIMMSLYKSLVRPHLDCCAQSWSLHLQKEVEELEKGSKDNECHGGASR